MIELDISTKRVSIQRLVTGKSNQEVLYRAFPDLHLSSTNTNHAKKAVGKLLESHNLSVKRQIVAYAKEMEKNEIC